MALKTYAGNDISTHIIKGTWKVNDNVAFIGQKELAVKFDKTFKSKPKIFMSCHATDNDFIGYVTELTMFAKTITTKSCILVAHNRNGSYGITTNIDYMIIGEI